MNTALRNGADSFLARFDGLRGRLPGDRSIRDAAAETFRRDGLPGVKDEAWRYTSLRPLAEVSFQEPLTAISPGAHEALPELDAPRLVFVDGRYQPELSQLPALFHAATFADVPSFGHLANTDQPMVALNTMLAEDGAVLSLDEGVDGGTIVLASLASDVHHRPIAFHPRHAVRLAAGARLVVIEVARGRGSYLHNAVWEAEVADGAHLTHIRLQDESAEAFHISTIYADLAERATYDAFTLNLGARVSRAEIRARLHGAGGALHLNGAQLLSRTQHSDITTVVQHHAPSCASRQTVKHVLAGRSRGVFQGRIEVARAAQKTDGYQMNQALLLSPDSEIDCKPELEIYADDVKCSHGATVGELNAEQLFYLRSRGVPLDQARSLLVRAFLAEALDPIAHEGARGLLDGAIEAWWMRQPT